MNKIKKVSFSSGNAYSTETTKTWRPLILVIAFRGLKTRKALNAPNPLFPPPPPIKPYMTVNQDEPTMIKSSSFQGSLR